MHWAHAARPAKEDDAEGYIKHLAGKAHTDDLGAQQIPQMSAFKLHVQDISMQACMYWVW